MATASTQSTISPPAAIHEAGERSRATAPGKARGSGEDERDQQLIATIEGMDLDPVQRAYMLGRWLGQVRYLGRSARMAQRQYYLFRLVAILGGVTIPALIGLSVDGRYQEWVRWSTFVLGLLVAAAVALEEFFRFGERWRHFRHQSEVLRSEGWAFLARSGVVYRRAASPEHAFRIFVARCEETLRHEVGVYVTEVVRSTESPHAEDGAAETARGHAPDGSDDDRKQPGTG